MEFMHKKEDGRTDGRTDRLKNYIYRRRNFIQKLYAKIYAQHNLIQLQDVYIICDDFFFYYSWYLKIVITQ